MNKTVLVVDDDKSLRTSLVRGLRANNFNVLTAPDADTADQILAKISVDAIVLDRMMMGMDGLTFLKQLRANGNNTPTIMLTPMGGPENRIDGLSAGADDYLGKPFQLQELVLRIENIIRRTPSEQPIPQMPTGLIFANDEFFIRSDDGTNKILTLSGEEKKLLYNLTVPVGSIVAAPPMVAKRLREKLNGVLLNIDIVTIRSRGYKLICLNQDGKTTKRGKK